MNRIGYPNEILRYSLDHKHLMLYIVRLFHLSHSPSAISV